MGCLVDLFMMSHVVDEVLGWKAGQLVVEQLLLMSRVLGLWLLGRQAGYIALSLLTRLSMHPHGTCRVVLRVHFAERQSPQAQRKSLRQ